MTFESHFDRFKPAARESTWKEAADPANGLLMDLGPHLVDQVLALFGWPEAVTVTGKAPGVAPDCTYQLGEPRGDTPSGACGLRPGVTAP